MENRQEELQEELRNLTRQFIDTKYIKLVEVLVLAYKRAAEGKGHQRHSQGEAFDQQMICRGPRIFGIGAQLYQVYKKSEETMKLDLNAKINELLDIINYAAAAVILLRENK